MNDNGSIDHRLVGEIRRIGELPFAGERRFFEGMLRFDACASLVGPEDCRALASQLYQGGAA